MGVKARPAAVEAIRQRVNQVSGHPAMGQVLKCLGAMAAGAVLAGAAVGGVLLPLPLALAAALGLGLESFAAYAGGCLGYAVLWGLDAGLEPMAAGLLAEACLCIFGDQLSRDNRWFAPGAATLFTILWASSFCSSSASPQRRCGALPFAPRRRAAGRCSFAGRWRGRRCRGCACWRRWSACLWRGRP